MILNFQKKKSEKMKNFRQIFENFIFNFQIIFESFYEVIYKKREIYRIMNILEKTFKKKKFYF